MNAKELRGAAERLKQEFDADADSPYPDASDIAVQLEQNDIACLITHILSTVREDDDEPVTPERLVEIGGEQDEDDMPGDEFLHIWFSSPESETRDYLITFRRHGDDMRLFAWSSPREIDDWLLPRTIKEARELLERCGALP